MVIYCESVRSLVVGIVIFICNIGIDDMFDRKKVFFIVYIINYYVKCFLWEVICNF